MTSPPNERNERNGASDGLLFITGTSLEDFKSTKNMTTVRRKAMGSYLKEKKPRGAQKEQQGGLGEDSSGSRSSVGSDQQDITSNSEAIRLMNGDGRTKSSQSTSFPRSPKTRTRKTPESQVSRLPRISMDFVLPSAPIVIPSRTGVRLPYDETCPKPFQSIGKPLDPFRTMPQASHPQVSVEELKFHCSISFGTKAMGMYWIPTLIKSPHAFLSTLCIASAHYDAVNERPSESIQTLALRQEVMHLIGQNMLNPESREDDYNVIALTQLLTSEIIVGDNMPLDFHENGIERMVTQRGGLEQLGVSGRLASTLSWVSLECAILREAKPRSQYIDYAAAASTRSYPNTATIPESPLYCPRSEFETIKRSSRCSPQALDMLKDIRMRMDLFLHETKQSRHNSLSLKNIHKKITTQYPPISQLRKKSVLTANDWRYEAIRITAILTATAIAQRIPLSEALKQVAEAENPDALDTFLSIATTTTLRQDFTAQPTNPFALPTTRLSFPSPQHSNPTTSLLKHLKTALEHSNLSDCWADMAGVLLWVALTAGAASRRNESKVLKKWFRALAVRVSIVLCFEHPEAMHASMLRMGIWWGAWVGKGRRGGRGGRSE
ncbi:uncharacterized protein N0V89_005148 [Didymosphaeria variabile]|uniref:Tachykinin family protein n=1 Tax=Didymosphaeria variabile TaxID=1932322 RepID=A0A9W8XKY6_9PLEO|nr:uncharacterized protein N0V89_005148 [Didymosphaeria variabile]KAJ4353419.1 hypothetical protein N0V89_005148 [Didymosphaeria variabile]